MLDALSGKKKMNWLNLNYTKPQMDQVKKLKNIYGNINTFDTFRGFNIGLNDDLLEQLLQGMLDSSQKPLALTMIILSYSNFGPKSLPLLTEFTSKCKVLNTIHLTDVGLRGNEFTKFLKSLDHTAQTGVLKILGLNKNDLS